MTTDLVDGAQLTSVYPVKDTINSLLREAEVYGKVILWSKPPSNSFFGEEYRTYHVGIEFNTIKGIDLEARSEHHHPSLEEALTDALTKAKKIREQFK